MTIDTIFFGFLLINGVLLLGTLIARDITRWQLKKLERMQAEIEAFDSVLAMRPPVKELKTVDDVIACMEWQLSEEKAMVAIKKSSPKLFKRIRTDERMIAVLESTDFNSAAKDIIADPPSLAKMQELVDTRHAVADAALKRQQTKKRKSEIL